MHLNVFSYIVTTAVWQKGWLLRSNENNWLLFCWTRPSTLASARAIELPRLGQSRHFPWDLALRGEFSILVDELWIKGDKSFLLVSLPQFCVRLAFLAAMILWPSPAPLDLVLYLRPRVSLTGSQSMT